MALLRHLRRASTAGFLLLVSSAPASAQALHDALGAPADLQLSGSVRLRYEAIDGQFRPGFRESEDAVSIRTIVTAEYRTGHFRIGGELWDSRVYAVDTGSAVGTGEIDAFEPVQAYVAADFPDALGKGSTASVTAGRLLLNLGSRRLFAADEYRNTTNGFTGVRTDLKARDGTSLTLIYVLPQLRLPDDQPSLLRNRVALDKESFAVRAWGGLLTKPKLFGRNNLELGYYGFAERDAPGRPTRDRRLHMVDARVIRDPAPGSFDYEAEGIYQLGHISASTAANAARLNVAAGFFHADIGYSFKAAWKPHLSLEVDYASGDGPGASYARFDTLYGMRRADFGPAGLYNGVTRANIRTVGVRLEAKPDKRSDGFLTYRPMWLAAPTDAFATTGVRDASGRSGSFAGHQLEGRYRRWLVQDRLRTEINAVWLAKRGVLRTAPNAPPWGDTHYLSLALSALF